jgi:hypothetical protein
MTGPLGRGGIGGRSNLSSTGLPVIGAGLDEVARPVAAMASSSACGGAIPEYTLTGILKGSTMSWGFECQQSGKLSTVTRSEHTFMSPIVP